MAQKNNAPSLRQRLLQVAKSLWLIVVFAGAAWYFIQNFDDVVAELNRISPERIFICLAAITIGRLLMVEVPREALRLETWYPSYLDMFVIYSLNDLAKYLPGGIWHFVGRAGYYRARGLSLRQITRLLIIENIWFVTSAACSSLLFLLLARQLNAPPMLVVPLLAIWLLLLYLTKRATPAEVRPPALGRSMGVQCLIWVLLGASYAALLPLPFSLGQLFFIIGVFAISWLVGFVTLFAPGGIGVREALLTGLLASLLSPEIGIIYATLHRLFWVCIELLLGIIAGWFQRRIS